ncbi:hypothetical protein HW555_013031 [Spodoptera exigua]|uniref:Uncharacterized protein n=1 Tax=Spodoptera exigua TaxID=7107 RepID=A0A835L063_SPOEX|nr:hypothetical protein HW555_013031 [Spodoptera exigua]
MGKSKSQKNLKAGGGDDPWNCVKQLAQCGSAVVVVALVLWILYLLLAATVEDWLEGPYCNRACRRSCSEE